MSERTVTATQARVRFGEILRQVSGGSGAVVVARLGEPQVVILAFREYQSLRDRVDRGSRVGLDRALSVGERIARRRGGVPLPPPEDVIASSREERDEDVLGMP
jgi:prevent-host-death family protein